MPVITIYSEKEKPAWSYDYKKKQWRGFLLDCFKFDGENKPFKRIRVQYARREAAEAAMLEIEIEKQNARAGILQPKHKKEITLKELFDKRLPQVSDGDSVRAKRIFSAFMNLTSEDFPVTSLKTAHFADYNRLRLSSGIKPASLRREINVLSPAFKKASEMFAELEDYTPPRIPRPKIKRDDSKKRIISESEKSAILAYLTRDEEAKETRAAFENRVRVGRIFEIGWLLGLRFSEIARLKKTDFKPKRKTLRVVRRKTGNVTDYDFLPEFILELIQTAVNDSRTEYIFTFSGSRPRHFYILIREACEAAGLTYGRAAENGIVFHSTRHAFVTRMVRVTDLATAGSYSGHQSSGMIAHYSHATDESRESAMQKLYPTANKGNINSLKEIYEKVRNNEMGFDEFKRLISG